MMVGIKIYFFFCIFFCTNHYGCENSRKNNTNNISEFYFRFLELRKSNANNNSEFWFRFLELRKSNANNNSEFWFRFLELRK